MPPKLTPAERTARLNAISRIVEGRANYAEIAVEFGVPQVNVRTWVSRWRKRQAAEPATAAREVPPARADPEPGQIEIDWPDIERRMLQVLIRAAKAGSVSAARSVLARLDATRERERVTLDVDPVEVSRRDYLEHTLRETARHIQLLASDSHLSGQAIAALLRQQREIRDTLDEERAAELASEDLTTEDMVAGILAMPPDVLTAPRLLDWYRTYLDTGDYWEARRTALAVVEG